MRKHVNKCDVGHQDHFGQKNKLCKPSSFVNFQTHQLALAILHTPTKVMRMASATMHQSIELTNYMIAIKAMNPKKPKVLTR